MSKSILGAKAVSNKGRIETIVNLPTDWSDCHNAVCWEAKQKFSNRWKSVNFASAKHDLGFTLINQLSVADKRFLRTEHDIASDYFALKKAFNGNKWAFTEGKNALNQSSDCDIAWVGALPSEAPKTDPAGN